MNNCNITKLKNGITIVSEHIPHVKSFSLGFWFNVGARDEIKSNNGISHFLEHMFFKGTSKRSAKKISDDIESLGGYLNAFTTKENTCFYGRGLSQHLPITFEVISDMLQNSIFKPKEVEKEAKVVIDELLDIEDSPEELIFDKLETNIFHGNSLSLPIIGREKNIENFTSESLFDYISKKYGSNKLYIVASGFVDHNSLIKLTNKFFDGKFGKSKSLRKKVNLLKAEDEFLSKDVQQSHLIIGRPTVGYNSEDRVKVNLISHILGEGSSSRLFQKIREKYGIAYQINTFLNSYKEVSSFGVYFSTNNESALKAKELIYKEFEDLRNNKISQKELKRAKEYIKGSMIMSLESTTNRMMRIAHSVIFYGRFKTIEESIEELERVTAEDILTISNELLDTEKFSTVILSSKNIINSAA